MATLLTLKSFALALFMFLGCNAVPDQFELGYGQAWHDAGVLGDHHNTFVSEPGDSQMVWAALSWDLGPRQVQVVDFAPAEVFISVQPQEPIKVPVTPPVALPDDHAVTDHLTNQVKEGVGIFTTFDVVTRVAILAFIVAIAWIFRKRIATMFPKFGNGNNKK